MKRAVCIVLALCLVCACAYADPPCSYYDEYQTHAWECYSYTEATCISKGYRYWRCSVCGTEHTYEVIPNDNHDWQEEKILSYSSCTENGETLEKCSRCQKERTVTVPASGHYFPTWAVTKQPTCSESGSRHAYCDYCGMEKKETLPKTDHDYGEWEVSVPATDHSMGHRSGRCRFCGQERTEDFYPDGTLYRGMDKCDEVRQMQAILIDQKYLHDSADGIFGAKTEQAVKDFQKEKGFEVTGIAYPQTLRAITGKEEETVAPPETEQARAEERVTYPYCVFDIDADGNKVPVLCETHMAVENVANMLLGSVKEGDDRITVLRQVRTLWMMELERQYACLKSETDMPDSLNKEYNDFTQALATWESVWGVLYENEEEPLMAEIGMIRARCMDKCALMYHGSGDDAETAGDAVIDVGIGEDDADMAEIGE